MSKQITATELAEIVKKLLVDMDSAGELASREQYQNFMTDIAQVVCDHCGGEIHHQADDLDDIWYIGIHGNDSLPDNGGIWAGHDKEGELFDQDKPDHPEIQEQTRDEFMEADAAIVLKFEKLSDDEIAELVGGALSRGYAGEDLGILVDVIQGSFPEHPISVWHDDGESTAKSILMLEVWCDEELQVVADKHVQQVQSRDIFSEAMQANFISTSVSEREEISIQRGIVAQEILARYPLYTVISREQYDADTVFGECLICVNKEFEFPAWEGRTIGDFLRRHGVYKNAPLDVIKHRTISPNKDGECVSNITVLQLSNASPSGETGWLLPSGLEVWFHQNSKD